MQNTIVVATHNQGKVAEFTRLFAPFGVKVLSAADLSIGDCEETEDTFVGNAILKAKHAVDMINRPALADDSGLVIPSLGGHPGVRSSRWAQQCGGFEQSFAKLEESLSGIDDKSAYFECALALAQLDGACETFVGRVYGQIVFPPRGKNLLGYDPIFVPDGHSRTFAEMAPEEKLRISHRAKAAEQLINKCFK